MLATRTKPPIIIWPHLRCAQDEPASRKRTSPTPSMSAKKQKMSAEREIEIYVGGVRIRVPSYLALRVEPLE